jgi:hypothetical protein
MQGNTEADIAFFDTPMQSPFAKGGNSLQPTAVILKVAPPSHIQEPFENLPPKVMTSGSCSSKKYS